MPFEGSLCPDKTSYPTNRHYLYYSGSELSAPLLLAPGRPPPGAHGPRAAAPRAACSTPGWPRPSAPPASGCSPRPPRASWSPTRPGRRGRVPTLRGAPGWARLAHRVLHRWSVKPYLYAPKARPRPAPAGGLAGAPLRHGRCGSGARRGVVLAAGGFVANRPMMREHAPAYRGGLPLGTPGDDGSGIRLGDRRRRRDRVPGPGLGLALPQPAARPAGRRAGGPRRRRVCDESRYGAAIGDAIVRHGGRAWLLADRATLAEARRQVRGSTLWFQRLQALVPADRRPGQRAHRRRGGGPRRASTRTGWRPRWPPTTPRRATRRCPTRPESPPPRAGRRTSRRSR